MAGKAWWQYQLYLWWQECEKGGRTEEAAREMNAGVQLDVSSYPAQSMM